MHEISHPALVLLCVSSNTQNSAVDAVEVLVSYAGVHVRERPSIPFFQSKQQQKISWLQHRDTHRSCSASSLLLLLLLCQFYQRDRCLPLSFSLFLALSPPPPLSSPLLSSSLFSSLLSLSVCLCTSSAPSLPYSLAQPSVVESVISQQAPSPFSLHSLSSCK